MLPSLNQLRSQAPTLSHLPINLTALNKPAALTPNARDKLKIGLTYLILIPIDLNMIKEGGIYWSLFQKE